MSGTALPAPRPRARARRRPAMFEGFVLDLVTGERRRLRREELRECWRLWRKHADIRSGRALR